MVTKAQLIQRFRLPSIDSIKEDVERIRRQGTNVALEGLAHAKKLMTMESFSSWLGQDDSRLLVVDGHCKNFGYAKTSPLSIFCASLASTLSQSSSLVVLQFFCGHHTMDSGDLLGGPLGLIKSLLGQLLHQPNDVLPAELYLASNLYDQASHENIDQLCQVFEALFSQIDPTKITICLIDSIADYEGTFGGWVNGMCLIADQLKYMVHRFAGSTPIFKVLMTSAEKSTMVASRVEAEDKVSLRGYGIPNHMAGGLAISSTDLSLPPVPSPGGSIYESQ